MAIGVPGVSPDNCAWQKWGTAIEFGKHPPSENGGVGLHPFDACTEKKPLRRVKGMALPLLRVQGAITPAGVQGKNPCAGSRGWHSLCRGFLGARKPIRQGTGVQPRRTHCLQCISALFEPSPSTICSLTETPPRLSI